MSTLMSDSQLLRICNSLNREEVRCLSVFLGVSNPEIDDIVNQYTHMQKFYSLRICREKDKTCKDFVKAMEDAKINKHAMCQVFHRTTS